MPQLNEVLFIMRPLISSTLQERSFVNTLLQLVLVSAHKQLQPGLLLNEVKDVRLERITEWSPSKKKAIFNQCSVADTRCILILQLN